MEAFNTFEHSLGYIALLAISYIVLSQVRSSIAWRKRSGGRPLPPGPRPLPVIGNLLDMPRSKQWVGFRDLCREYGELVYLNVLGKPLLVVGSARAATELLEKRSAHTSDRPPSTLLPLMGGDVAMSMMPYGARWRDHRRAFWQVFHPGVIGSYRDTEIKATRRFVTNLLKSPQDFREHIRSVLAAASMKVLYDLDAEEPENKPLANKVKDALSCTSELATGNHPVELFPFLRHVPGWVPGAGFHYALASCKAAVMRLKEAPFEKMRSAFNEGRLEACALGTLMSRVDPKAPDLAYQVDTIKNIGFIGFQAGSDTTYSTLAGFFLAISQNPDIQQKAQAELDAIVGRGRMPDFGDQDKLVYVNAVIKEALRWHVVLPFAVPHRSVEDDVYDGYFIPAGTAIIPNSWAMLHDPDLYDRPEEFRPERFVRDGKNDTATAQDPAAFAFGYGRRVCAGRYFAEDMLFLTIASVLHIFDVEPPVDETGKAVKIQLEQSHGILSYPEDCRCVIKPRSAEAADLILEAQDGPDPSWLGMVTGEAVKSG